MRIIYWSGTGNTREMANLILLGIQNKGKNTEIFSIEEVNIEKIKEEEFLILGCPAMGDEVLEETEFEPFIESLSLYLKNKKVALFGSYGWGDGQWMRDWEERMISYGAQIIGEPLMVNYLPEGDSIDECLKFGELIAESI